MLNRPERIKFEAASFPIEQEATTDISDVLSFLSRYRYTVIGIATIGILLSSAYLFLAPVRYAATAQVIIDPHRFQAGQQAGVSDGPLDTSTIESQVAVLKSGSIIQAVISNLDLLRDDEFAGTRPSPLQPILALIQKQEPRPTPEQRLRLAARQMQKALTVRRVGVSYVIDIEFRSEDRVKAARIANAIAEAYRSSQVEVTKEAIRRANSWLEERLAVLREETLATEKAVQDFKAQSKNLNSGATLLDLESQAQMQRKIYESFYQRYLETSQQLSYPILEARVITPATPPLTKSEPRTIITLGLGAILGLALGIAVAFIRDRVAR